MKWKLGLLIIFLIFIMTGSASASYYYEYVDPLSENNFYNSNMDSNEIIIDFYGNWDSYISVYVPDNNFYLQSEIYDVISDLRSNPCADVNTLKGEVEEICRDYGIDNPNITVTSPWGDDSFIYLSVASGISMEPTVRDGSMLVINKTRDIHVGDIVSAYYRPQNIPILKRVSVIDGDDVYLVSDNVNGTIVENGEEYAYEGLRAWVNMSDIDGVLIDSYSGSPKGYGDVIML